MVVGAATGEAMIRRPPTFELVGMPGSGKSTITPLVREYFGTAGLPIESPVQLEKGEAEARLREEDPRLWSDSRRFLDAVVALRHAEGHGSPEKLSALVSNLWFGQVHAARVAHRGTAAVFFEESMLHELWRMTHLLRGTDEGEIVVRQLWPQIAKCSTVIKIDVHPEVRHRRMKSKARLGPINRHLAQHAPDSPLWVDTERSYDELIRRSTRFWRRLVVVPNHEDGAEERVAWEVVDAVVSRLGRDVRSAYRSSSNPSR